MILTLMGCGGTIAASSLEDRMLESVELVVDGETYDFGRGEAVTRERPRRSRSRADSRRSCCFDGRASHSRAYEHPSPDVHVLRVTDAQLCEFEDVPGPGELAPEHCRPVGDVELSLTGSIGDDGWCATAATVDDSDAASPMCVPPDDNDDKDYWHCDEGPSSPVVPPPQDFG